MRSSIGSSDTASVLLNTMHSPPSLRIATSKETRVRVEVLEHHHKRLTCRDPAVVRAALGKIALHRMGIGKKMFEGCSVEGVDIEEMPYSHVQANS